MEIVTIPGIGYDSNIYLIQGKYSTIIDTGTGLNSTSVVQELNKHLRSKVINQIILTHEHYDHVGGTPDIMKEFDDCKLVALSTALPKLRKGESSFASLLGGTMPRLEVNSILDDGKKIIIGDEEFLVLATPGHSPGSLCLYNEKDHVLFSGDTVFADGGFGRYDFPGGNLQQLHDSVQRLTHLSVDSLYPGHGPVITTKGSYHINLAYQNICQCASYP